MELIALISLSLLLACSVAGNVLQFLKLKKAKSAAQETYDVRSLLHDLTSGVALVEIKRVAPSHVFLRSPREDG